MLESLWVLGALGALIALGSVAALSATALLACGAAMLGLGFAIGLPAGAYYHLLLYRGLRDGGGVPQGWYWRPTAHHASVSSQVRSRFRPWFLAGALGFSLIILGCLVIALASMVMKPGNL